MVPLINPEGGVNSPGESSCVKLGDCLVVPLINPEGGPINPGSPSFGSNGPINPGSPSFGGLCVSGGITSGGCHLDGGALGSNGPINPGSPSFGSNGPINPGSPSSENPDGFFAGMGSSVTDGTPDESRFCVVDFFFLFSSMAALCSFV